MTSEQLLEKVDLDVGETVCCSSIGQEEYRILYQDRKYPLFIVFILLSSIMFSTQGDSYKISCYIFQRKECRE